MGRQDESQLTMMRRLDLLMGSQGEVRLGRYRVGDGVLKKGMNKLGMSNAATELCFRSISEGYWQQESDSAQLSWS